MNCASTVSFLLILSLVGVSQQLFGNVSATTFLRTFFHFNVSLNFWLTELFSNNNYVGSQLRLYGNNIAALHKKNISFDIQCFKQTENTICFSLTLLESFRLSEMPSPTTTYLSR